MKPAHKGATKYYDPLDGDVYIKNTINWFIKKGCTSKYQKLRVSPITLSQGNTVPYEAIYPFRVSYTFPVDCTDKLVCKEILYVSDKRLESHYKKLHPNNSSKHGSSTSSSVVRHTNLH